ncbi:hypothetical protein M1439_00835 [Candidatus Marsarchaeota archaeon]|nr:hypothetical protein [Candidatus Marsarchaeota archaeon]
MMNKALALSKLKRSKLTPFQKRVLMEASDILLGILKYQSAEPQPTSRLHLHAAGPMHIGQSAQH